MNVFQKVTLQSLKKNRTRTTVTVIGIILSAAMICAVTTFASSVQNFALQEEAYTSGNWHGRALDQEYKTFETVRDSSQIEEAACFQQLGYAEAEGCKNMFKPYIYLLGAGENAEDMLPIHRTDGRFPASPEEILLPEHVRSNGGLRVQIGDRLTLSLGQRVLDGDVLTQETPCYINQNGETVRNGETLEIRETRTYTVVGFYERMNWRIEQTTAPGYTALTLADEEPSAACSYDVYFRMKKPGDVYAFMSRNKLGDSTNRDLLMVTGTFRFNTFGTMLYGLSAIVIGLIMFGSVALIYNAFSISVSERTKQFGLLSSVGATKKQLRRMVLFEAFAVSLVGIPLGILSGVGGIGVTLLLIGDRFRSVFGHGKMTLSVSPASIVAAAAVALLTVLISAWIPSRQAMKVSAVEAIRQNADVSAKERSVKTPGWIYALFGLPGVLARKYYRRSRKKYRATVLSLFMSIVLFVSASAFTEYLTETVSGGLETVDYDLMYMADCENFDRITPQELKEQIAAVKTVTGVACVRERYGWDVKIRPEYLTAEGSAFCRGNMHQEEDDPMLAIRLWLRFVDDASFQKLLKENRLKEEKFLNPEKPLALVWDGVTVFNNDTHRYENTRFFDRDEFELDFRKEKEDGTEDRALLQVGEVITERPAFVQDGGDPWVIYPLSLANAVFADYEESTDGRYDFMIWSDDHVSGGEAVKTALSENGFSSDNLYDFAEQLEADRSIVTIIRVFACGFIVLISLIAAANVFHTISTNISLRRREFAMLKSVGMTRKGFRRMMNYECLLYGTRALLYGLPVSFGVTFLIYLSVMSGYETTFRLPWAAAGAAAFCVFLVVFVTMVYAMNKIRKENLIDALKNENL